MEYPKINSLWMREPLDSSPKRKLIPGQYSQPEFASITQWRVEEKIDGMNIRIYVHGDQIEVKGRTQHAKIPPKLRDYFNDPELRQRLSSFLPVPYILFGEGFGAGIQCGGIYRPTQAFVLFDIYVKRWSTREEVYGLAPSLGFDTPHDFGMMTEDEIIDLVKSAPSTRYHFDKVWHPNSNRTMEGVVVRSEPLMRFNTQQAQPIMWKLKVRDFHG